jgi:predicted nucleic acid-binding protein
MRLYLDANPIIYSIEGVPEFRTAALAWIEEAEAAGGAVITSRLSRLECRVRPIRDGNTELLARFEGFFAREGLELAEITAEVVETATALRATHGFRPPDAIHLATARPARRGGRACTGGFERSGIGHKRRVSCSSVVAQPCLYTLT